MTFKFSTTFALTLAVVLLLVLPSMVSATAKHQCQTNANCTSYDPSQWCRYGECAACSMFCYSSKDERSSGANYTLSECPEDCCGWSTFPTDTDTTSEGERFHYGLCNAQQYDNFTALYIKQSTIGSGQVASLKSGAIFGPTPDDAINAGAHYCNVKVDENPAGVYPRKVPYFDCTFDPQDRCDDDHVGLVVYARIGGHYTILNHTYLFSKHTGELCGLGSEILRIFLIGAGISLAVAFVIGGVIFCVCRARRQPTSSTQPEHNSQAMVNYPQGQHMQQGVVVAQPVHQQAPHSAI